MREVDARPWRRECMARKVIQPQPMIMGTRSSRTASPTPAYSRRYRRVSFAWFMPVTSEQTRAIPGLLCSLSSGTLLLCS